jgi:hypothetical protein
LKVGFGWVEEIEMLMWDKRIKLKEKETSKTSSNIQVKPNIIKHQKHHKEKF